MSGSKISTLQATPLREPSSRRDESFRETVNRRTSLSPCAPISPSKTKSMRRAPTWLDRRLVAKEQIALSEAGFGREARDAIDARAEHLLAEGLARRQGQRFIFVGDLLNTLRQRELASAGAKLATQSGLPHRIVAEGELVAGVYRQRLNLASGRFAVIDDGLGFSLVPWSPSLEQRLGKHVSGVMSPGGVVDWSFGRKRGIGL